MRLSRRWRQFGISIVILASTVAAAGLLAGGRELYLVSFLMAVWCAVSAWRRSSQREGRHRLGWRGIALGAGSTALGQVWWFARPPSVETTWGDLPGHFGMAGALVIFLTSMACLRPPRREAADERLVLLDLVIVTATLATAIWSLVLSPLGVREWRLDATTVATLMHAVSGGSLLLGLFVIGLRLPAIGGQRSVTLIASGLTAVALADLSWIAIQVNTNDGDGQLGASLVAASLTLLAIALGRERRRYVARPSLDESEPVSEGVWRLWLLYPPVLLISLIVGEAAIGGMTESTDPIVVLGGLVVIALVLLRQGLAIQETRRLAVELRRQADHDPLTNLLNHRRLHELLERELNDTIWTGLPVSVALIDVDRFKQINDVLGHVVGDHVLRAIAGALTRACRETDIAARYAGDEFALVLPGLDGVSAAAVGDRLLDEVAALAYWPGPDAEHPVSISIGFAVSRTGRLSSRQMVAAADEALYSAKRAGRNQFAIVNADMIEHDEEPAVNLRRLIVAHPAR